MDTIRLVVADDHAVLRAGLRMLLNAQPDMVVAGEAADGQEAVAAVGALAPDVVLMDITMPSGGGLAATKEIRRLYPKVRVLVLTMHDDEGYTRQFLRAGASGYVLKKAADTELTAAIRAVHRGDVYIHPSMVRGLVGGLLDGQPQREAAGAHGAKLTSREREVMALVASGYTNQETADKLFVSVKTIETHRAHIMDKLALRNRADLVRYAVEHGLLQGPGEGPAPG
ncbi:MAG: response regulator transcription factor [Candidatus Latescibacterota bacterium]